MKCKFCGEEMPDNGRFCPFCGKDNGQEEGLPVEPAIEQSEIPVQAAQAQADAKVKSWKRIAAVSGCIAAMAVLALVFYLVICGLPEHEHKFGDWEILSEADCTKVGEKVRKCSCGETQTEAIPTVSHKYVDQVCQYCGKKGYTVSNEDAVKRADTVVATLGDVQLTNGQLQIYYQMELINFVNEFSYYLSYFGLDYTKPLDAQECAFKEGYTWQQYFLESAISTWQQYQTLALEAEKNNFQLDSELQEYLDNLDTTMADLAKQQGYDDTDAFLQAQCGSNVTMADYRSYMEVYYNGYMYLGQRYNAFEKLTDEQLDAYFQKNKETLEGNGIKQDGSYTIDVRHILIKADGTENEDGTITFKDAEAAAEAKAKAEEILAKWLENPTEENFAALAKEHTADSNGEAGGLCKDVAEGYMVASFNDWCFDENRKVGDYGIVETRFGYHIMFFSARGEDTWKTKTQQAYLNEQSEKMINEMMEQYEMKVSYEQIALAYVSLG